MEAKRGKLLVSLWSLGYPPHLCLSHTEETCNILAQVPTPQFFPRLPTQLPI